MKHGYRWDSPGLTAQSVSCIIYRNDHDTDIFSSLSKYANDIKVGDVINGEKTVTLCKKVSAKNMMSQKYGRWHLTLVSMKYLEWIHLLLLLRLLHTKF